jgi:hypothetical protein
MAHIASNMIAQTRAHFADQAHAVLTGAHGHHFPRPVQQRPPQQRRPPPQQRPPPPQQQQQQQDPGEQPQTRKRAVSEMVDNTPPADPEALLAQKQQKIAAHNARILAINNSKSKAQEQEPSGQSELPK